MTIGDFLVLLAVLGAYIAIMDRLASLQRLIEMMHPLNPRSPTLREADGDTCPSCLGSGRYPIGIDTTLCNRCNGSGHV